MNGQLFHLESTSLKYRATLLLNQKPISHFNLIIYFKALSGRRKQIEQNSIIYMLHTGAIFS